MEHQNQFKMNTPTHTERLENARKIWKTMSAKEGFHFAKHMRARKPENQDFHYKAYKLYRDAESRAAKMFFAVQSNKKFGAGRAWFEQTAEQYTTMVENSKREAKLKFDSKIQVQLYFMQNTLHADYGTHTCAKCSDKFHHSPSDVYRGKNLEYSNVCGYCVNNLLESNDQEPLFS